MCKSIKVYFTFNEEPLILFQKMFYNRKILNREIAWRHLPETKLYTKRKATR